MKHLVSFLLLLVLLSAQTQTLTRTSLISPSLTIASPISIPQFKIPPILQLPSSAICYEGTVKVNIQQGSSSDMSYFICFDQQTSNCSYMNCYNGWVANYTTDTQTVVQGYPKGTGVSPVFIFKTNSALDYEIVRSPQLSSAFVDIIQIACASFDPSIGAPTNAAASARRVNTLSFSSTITQSVYLPKYILSDKAGLTGVKIGSAPLLNLDFSQLSANAATLSRSFQFDSQQKLINTRTDSVNIRLPSDLLSNDPNTEPNDFVGAISLNLRKVGSQIYNSTVLKNKLNEIAKSSFNINQIETRRAKVVVIDDRNDNVRPVDTLITNQPNPSEIVEQLSLDVAAELSRTPSVDVNVLSAQSLTLNPFIPNGRLLAGSVQLIFSTQKVLFDKSILGKKIKVSILVTAQLIDKYSVRIVGTIKFVLFGNTKSIKIFEYTRNVNFNWSLNKSFSGSWGFNFYVPLPPPVSFMGINFGVSASFSIEVGLFANGVYTASINVYDFKIGAVASTGVTVDASAALRIIAIEGGVYIKGTLFKVSTDPTLSLKYKLGTKQLAITALWKFYLKAFESQWGFFWRYWKPFSWSGKKIIATYKISQGVSATYTLLNIVKNYNL